MSERRSVIAPPEITNGSRSGSVSSNSSARAIRVIVIYAAPRQDPETKHNHQEVCTLDPVTLSQPPHPMGQEDDNPEASQHGDGGPTRPRPGWIDAPAPGQDPGEREKREPSQATTFVHPFSPGTRSRKCSSPPRRARVPAASRSSMTASNPSRGSNTNAWSARWVREP